MTSPKPSIALDPAVAAEARAQAQREGPAGSAWLNHAAERELRLADGLAAVADFEAEDGPFTAAEQHTASALADRYRVGVDRAHDASV